MGNRNPEAQAGQPATTPPKNAIEQIASLLNQLHNGIDQMQVAALVNLWGIQGYVLGEWHFDPAMIQREKEFLELLRRHGVQTLIIEYPKDQQARLNRYLRDPTYANMADALSAFILEMVGMEPAKRAKVVARLAQELQAVDANPREAQRADPNLTDAVVALDQAEMRMARTWLAANRMGFAVLAGDLPLREVRDESGKRIPNPSTQQISHYRVSGQGMHDRNESMSRWPRIAAAPLPSSWGTTTQALPRAGSTTCSKGMASE